MGDKWAPFIFQGYYSLVQVEWNSNCGVYERIIHFYKAVGRGEEVTVVRLQNSHIKLERLLGRGLSTLPSRHIISFH